MDEKKPLISIIVPVYNVEDYIEECLESLVKQTYKNLEIILIVMGLQITVEKFVMIMF